MKAAHRIALLLTGASTLLWTAGCGRIEPWVKPYERERLADPVMVLDPDPVSSSYIDHVFEVREGARGATGGAGGGCGCN
jgi:DNA primase